MPKIDQNHRFAMYRQRFGCFHIGFVFFWAAYRPKYDSLESGIPETSQLVYETPWRYLLDILAACNNLLLPCLSSDCGF